MYPYSTIYHYVPLAMTPHGLQPYITGNDVSNQRPHTDQTMHAAAQRLRPSGFYKPYPSAAPHARSGKASPCHGDDDAPKPCCKGTGPDKNLHGTISTSTIVCAQGGPLASLQKDTREDWPDYGGHTLECGGACIGDIRIFGLAACTIDRSVRPNRREPAALRREHARDKDKGQKGLQVSSTCTAAWYRTNDKLTRAPKMIANG